MAVKRTVLLSFLALFVFFYPFFHLCLQQGLVRKTELVSGGIDISVFRQSQFYKGVVLFLAQQYADSGFLVVKLDIAVIIVYIHLHLAKVLMGEFVYLQVYQYIALQYAIIENKVNKEVLFIERETLLPGLEKESFAQFEKEIAHLCDDGALHLLSL